MNCITTSIGVVFALYAPDALVDYQKHCSVRNENTRFLTNEVEYSLFLSRKALIVLYRVVTSH